MNTKSLATALLLASATGHLTAAEVEGVHSHVIEILESKGSLKFIAAETVITPAGTFRPQLQLVPVASGAYSFVQDVPGSALGTEPGVDPGLDYQFIIQLINVETGRVQQTDAQYYAKVLGEGKAKVYFCDTTSVCSEDRGTKIVELNGDVLTIAGAEFFGNGLTGDHTFIALSK